MKGSLTKLVNSRKATNICCYKTNTPIFPNEGYYVLDGKCYCENVDINKEIQDVTNGEYKTADELYRDNDDFYYWTENYDEQTVVQEIIEQGFYYDKKGLKIFPPSSKK